VGVLVIGFHNAQKFMVGLEGYSNVHLTDTKADVLYRLGYPPWVVGEAEKVAEFGGGYSHRVYYTDNQTDPKNVMPAGKRIQDFDEWSYPIGGQSHGIISINVTFDHATNKVTRISCVDATDNTLHQCPPLAGINEGDTEEAVLQRFSGILSFLTGLANARI
jgi:hypothetical protein